MKALTIDQFKESTDLHWTDLPTPHPKANEVQIKIAYTSVNPVDWKICQGHMKDFFSYEFPLIPGWDAAGTISAIGADVKNFSIGDEVYAYCRKPVVQWGTYAEYICLESEHVAFKPESLSFAQAAAIPLVGLTAWQALFDSAHFKKGNSVLIHAGAGGVGSLAIGIAHHFGAKIYTTASKKNHPYVRSLGADYLIDYHDADFVAEMKKREPNGVDIVLDFVGYDTLKNSFGCVKKGGYLVSIVNKVDPKKCEELGIHGNFFVVRPEGQQLKKMAELFDSGKLKPPHIEEMPLSDYSEAFKKSQAGHTVGKIVLKVK